MKKLFGLSALVSPRVATGVGLIALTSLLGGTGCGLSYSLTGLYVEPGANLTCVGPGVTAQYIAYGTYTEGGHTARTQEITDQVAWSSSLPGVASINSSGVATGGPGVGQSDIVATTQGEFGVLTSTSNIKVLSGDACLNDLSIAGSPALSIIPGKATLTAAGDTEMPLAIALPRNGGHPTDLTRQVAWTSSDPQVATVDAAGRITAVAPGDAIITATVKTPGGETISATQTVHFTANNETR